MSGIAHQSNEARTGGAVGRRTLLAAGTSVLAASLAAPGIVQGQTTAASLAVVGKDGWLFPIWDKVTEEEANQTRPTVQTISRAIGLLKAARVEVAIVLVPSKARTYRQFLPDNLRVAPAVDRRYTGVLAEFKQAGAITPDLDAAFRARAAATQLFFKSDTHWTPMGAELAAIEVAKAVGPTLPPSSRPGLQVSAPVAKVNARGDLVRNLPEAQRASYGPEPYQVREVVAGGGQNALIADESTDVTIVGSSYVEPKYGFQPVFSNQLGRPVSLFWKPNNVGPYATILQYLASPGFKQQRPKLIVWTHLEVDLTGGPSSSGWGQNAMPPDKFLADLRQAVGA